MKILTYHVLKGPNYYSPYPVIIMKLDLGEKAILDSSSVDGFNDALLNYIPSLHKHYCSYGREGGFVLRLKEGTMFGHIVEHVCLELQNLADMEVNFGKTRESTVQGVFNVVYSYVEEESGKLAGKTAVNLVNHIIDGCLITDKSVEGFELASEVEMIREIQQDKDLGPSTKSLVEEAKHRGIPYIRLNRFNLIQMGHGKYQKKIEATITSKTSVISMDIAKNPEYFSRELESVGIPSSDTRYVYEYDEALQYLLDNKSPVMLKSSESRNGEGVTLNITSEEELKQAFDYASQVGNEFIIERYIAGFNYRILVVNGKFLAAAKRYPSKVIGNGNDNIKTLLEKENSLPERNMQEQSALSKIKITDVTNKLLQDKGLDWDYVPDKGEEINLHLSCKQDLGGYSVNVTEWVDIENQKMAEKATKLSGLDVAGIDVIANTLREPLYDTGGVITSINVSPDFRIHTYPLKGSSVNVARPVIDMLFPKDEPYSIPIVSITGTCGKTSVARMVSHILTMRGFDVGLSCSDGLYFRDEFIAKGDRTHREDMVTLLKDPYVDFSVFETSIECITSEGLGYQRADVGVILNISDEYTNDGEWKDLVDVGYVKLLVAEQLEDWGYAVLNADNELVMDLSRDIRSKCILFSVNKNNPLIRKHLTEGGIATVYERGSFDILIGNNTKTRVGNVYEIPITYDGKSKSGIYNVLATIATVYGIWRSIREDDKRTISIDDIRNGIISFSPTFNNNPFRQNRFFIIDSTFLIDSPSNPASFESYRDFIMKNTSGNRKALIYDLKSLSEKCWEKSAIHLSGLFDSIYVVNSDKTDSSLIKDKLLNNTGYKPSNIHIIEENHNIINNMFELENKNNICIYSLNKSIIEMLFKLKEEIDPLE